MSKWTMNKWSVELWKSLWVPLGEKKNPNFLTLGTKSVITLAQWKAPRWGHSKNKEPATRPDWQLDLQFGNVPYPWASHIIKYNTNIIKSLDISKLVSLNTYSIIKINYFIFLWWFMVTFIFNMSFTKQ